MKDGLGEAAVERIIGALLSSGAHFSPKQFRNDALSTLHQHELKDRVRHLIAVMARHLPPSFPETATILSRIRDHWPDDEGSDKRQVFAAWPIIDYVAEYGLNHPDIALPLLRYLTPMFSAEFAVRAFLMIHPEATYNQMLLWCLDPDTHVRRLASEGIRPRLPWAQQLTSYITDPTPVIALLENLKDDPSDDVRRSVANNLNDISKDHPEQVIDTCKRWQADQVSARQWIIRHATRTLVKAGHPKVFPLLGFTRRPQLDLAGPELSTQHLRLGETLGISVKVTSTSSENQRVVIDYAVHYIKSNGQSAPKVFKWKNLHLKPRQCVTLVKSQTFKKLTTRKHYPGDHQIKILVNGQPASHATFELHLA
ncbi:MAG: DNA alkylation repair protein [Verrucomicrobiae bacterium]|nr:DNA alkylation repair protein [Verrucomicrobiae bacterium]NNJ44285.1 DNA alkylation repair protein [Akkermansiaceae bacterium]